MEPNLNIKVFINYMKENNLSKTKFCKMCKVSPFVLQKILQNNCTFRITALFKIARVMKIQVYEMFE